MSTPQWSQMHLSTVTLTHESGEAVQIRSRIADDSRERAAGFQHICPELIALSSILFVYNKPKVVSFHMNNVHDALDIGFFDQNGELIKIARMIPNDSSNLLSNLYSSGDEIQYALETRAGFFADHGLEARSVVMTFR